MPKKKRRGATTPESNHLPPGCFRCSRCGRPWLKEQGRPIKGDVLCAICAEEFDMAVLRAMDAAQEAEYLIQRERAKFAKLN